MKASHQGIGQLAGRSSQPILELPTDRPRHAQTTARSARTALTLPPALTAALHAVAIWTDATVPTILLASFQTLLYRYTGQADLLVAARLDDTTTDYRAVHTALDGNPTLEELIERVRLAVTSAAPQVGPAQIAFDFGAREALVSEAELQLSLTARGETIEGALSYNSALFDAATIARMAGHLEQLLFELCADLDQPIKRAPLLTAAERAQLIRGWNAATIALPQRATMHSLFERQAARTPDAAALIVGEERLSYAELNRCANRLAHHLIGLGVGDETLVGVCLPRTVDLVVALLAILKAGGAYVPLDPAYPAERIGFILDDAAAPVVLTQRALEAQIAGARATIVCLDDAWDAADADHDHDPGRGAAANLGYIIYTSGSTGRPKGVAITHDNAVALLAWAADVFPRADLQGVLAATSICFDLSIFELFLPLSLGGAVILAKNALHLPTLPARDEVTLINTVPSAIAELAAMRAIPASVRTVNLAGEPLKRVLADQVYAAANVARVYNLYGPSEDTTYSTFTLVERDDAREPTIGRPIANTQAYILDDQLQPVPIGVIGELYLGGAGVSRGYLGRPTLTAERYLPDPFSAAPGARMYKTGDLTRYRADGQIEFLGRIDHQIKIRGFRIELGEIEAVLSRHPAISSVVVLARDYGRDKRLVAYVVGEQRTENREHGDNGAKEQESTAPEVESSALAQRAPLQPSALRQFLAQQLPEYMTPSAFIVLDAMPLTPNGKIDRTALPEPHELSAPSRPELASAFVAPRSETERMVATIWESVLGLSGLGVDDSFFELGGHSLLATQVISRISQMLHAAIPPQTFFEQPTIAELAAYIESSQPAALEQPRLTVAPRDAALPLSFAQQRLWFFDQLAPGSALYNVPAAIQISGALDQIALQASLDAIVERHESLRSVFVASERDGRAVQRILPPSPVALDYADLRAERAEVAHELMAEHARRPFDVERGPLLRALLVRQAEQEYRLLVTVHHIAFDGWSINVLIRELGARYAQAVGAGAVTLPELTIQYADFSAWQRRLLQGEQLEQQLAYWRTQLKGHLRPLELPTDRPRPATQSFRGAKLTRPLDPALLAELEQLGRQENASLFMILLAAFQVVLHRYSGQTEFVVGAPIANRNRPEIENLIGFFVNTLPLRADLAGDPSFLQLLGRVRQTALGGYAHQDLPLETLINALGIERDASRNPLFQVVFVMQNAPMQAVELPGLHMRFAEELDTGTAKFDLTLMIEFLADGPVASIEYSGDLFDRPTIERLLDHYQTVLSSIAMQPDMRASQPIAALPLLPAAERAQLAAWNDTATDYPRQATIAELFEAEAARAPESIALTFGERQISYGELNRRANRLAHQLIGLGVQTETLVGVCLERSPELIVALLAILKAGGAYLPLDPNYPKERLTLMLDDAQVTVLLSQRRLLERLPASDATLICLDDAQTDDQTQPASNPQPAATAENLAYVMYTSGSTGRPKGVSVPQRGVVRLVKATNYARFDADEVFLQLAPVSFDASTLEIWGALLNGARLVIFPPQIPTLEELAQIVERQGVSTLWLTAGLFHQMVHEQPQALRGVRQLLAGGDVLAVPQVVQVLQQQRPDAVLINGYGPTENTTFTTCYPMHDAAQVGHSVSIGRPIANTQVYVLDAEMQPTPIGVPGELYIGGDGLARDYLNRPALTAEKFVPNPFSAQPGARLYRSGDLVRWLADGAIEFLGRIDQQVKIRGFRIELGEIETALLEHPAVQEAVVIPREDAPGDKRLVAYIVLEQGTKEQENTGTDHRALITDHARELRAFLKRTLPDYMTPSAFVTLDALPLTANGKVDRRALAQSEYAPQTTLADAEQFTPLSTPTEQRLAALWTRLLGVARIGRQANFFELGGHSLLATQLASLIRSTFAVELPLSSLFNAPVLSALAVEIDARGQGVQIPPITPSGHAGDQPLSFAQQRLWFFDQWQPASPLYNIVVANRLSGALDLDLLERGLNEIVRRHAALRTTFPMVGQEPVQRVAAALSIALSVIDLSDLDAAKREDVARAEMQAEAAQPFDLERGPLLRAVAIWLSPAEHIFVLSMHHIISDGWSMEILTRELFTLYQSYGAGAASPLAELPVQYADFAAWQQRLLQGPALDEQLDYWRGKLAGAPTLLELPTDRPRPATQSFRGALASFALPRPISDALLTLTQQTGATPFMTLLAAWSTLLARYSGQSELIVGVPIANRTRAEIEPLIGCFVNTLALRIDLQDAPSFRELIQRVRDVALEAYVYQDLPFERLVTALHPERNLSHNPLFQVMFAFQNSDFTSFRLPQLTVSPIQLDPQTAMFDLTLDVIDTGDGLRATLEYSTDLFDAATIERLIANFQQLLASIVATPDASVARLPLLAEAETAALLSARDGEAVSYPHDRCIHTLFEAQAARTPDAIALALGQRQVSYAELNRRANQLAHALITRGVGPERMVGIAVERSIEMVVGLLGILKAGGAYVPIDPSYPQQRLSYILRDAGVQLLLTTRAVESRLADYAGATLYLDADWPAIAQQPATNPETAVRADNLMYVIYTSGSTGAPKGVMLQHRGASSHFHWMQQRFPLAQDDAVLQHTSFSFDVSVWEIFAPLLQGVRLVLAQPEDEKDPAYLARLIAEQRVTIVQLVPSLLRMLMEQREFARCDALRHVFCGGEAMPLDLPEQFYAGSAATLINMYGPTETTIDAAYWVCERGGSFANIPIGFPIGNAEAYVLDAEMQMTPIGVPGELYVGGHGVARGYLNRPALTAEKFVPNPFSAQPGARLYRSGDLVRWLADGTIEFLGRIDQQVKVRGFRIELGEIEAALLQHPAVHEAVVAAHAHGLDNRLTAYLTTSQTPTKGGLGAQSLVPGELRALLAQSLPEYMVPSAFVILDTLPLTPNGKIDRAALPAPELSAIESGTDYVAPRNGAETTLANLWAAVIGSAQVGIHDNFFALGGNSLLATRIVAQVRETLHVELPLRTLFEAPTVAELAQRIDQLAAEQPQAVSAPIDRIDADAAQSLLADFDDLSDDEIERLLSTLSEEDITSYE
jgi:amino acid adenylation domain-containing protein